MSRLRFSASLSLALFAALCGAPSAFAQEKPKDDLDRLLEKLENKAPEAKPDDKKTEPPKTEQKKAEAPQGKAEKPAADKPKGEVDPKDKDLDDLLGKLGGTPDTPDAKGKSSPPPGPGGDGPMPPDEAKKNGGLTDEQQKKLDEELEIRAGKIKKPKNQQQQQQQGSGPLTDAIKQMREVEERLGKTDTGEKTREEQKEIVKKLDTLLQELRRQQGKGQGRQMAQGQPQGNQPGQQDNPNPNPNQQGTGPQKPKTPSIKDMMGNDKQPWGNLPSSMRQDIQNIAKEGMLEVKKSLIERYFLTVTKKSATKE